MRSSCAANIRGLLILAGVAGILAGTGCNATLWLNPAFVNRSTGEVFPLAPGDRSGFVLVRVTNASDTPIEFVVTAERTEVSEDNPDETVVTAETYLLLVGTSQPANDLGVLIDCPVVRVGLGEDLDRPSTEPGMYIGAEAVGQGGFGVPSNMNPLSSEAGNFDCGDTIVFQARTAAGTAGGVVAAAFVLDDEAFSGEIVGIDTFVNARSFLEEQRIPTGE